MDAAPQGRHHGTVNLRGRQDVSGSVRCQRCYPYGSTAEGSPYGSRLHGPGLARFRLRSNRMQERSTSSSIPFRSSMKSDHRRKRSEDANNTFSMGLAKRNGTVYCASSASDYLQGPIPVYLQIVEIAANWPRGGVVTQRTANPCTPVRFRARPPSLP